MIQIPRVEQIEEITEEIVTQGIRGYKGHPEEDRLLLQWWTAMMQEGDLYDTFSKACKSLSVFYKLFQRPNWLFYTVDDEGITLAIWVEPIFSTACVGMWVAPRCRKSKSIFRSIQLIYQVIFTMFHTVLGVTKHKKLLTTHTRLGYNIVGRADGLIDDETCWIVQLSRESFENGKLNPRST